MLVARGIGVSCQTLLALAPQLWPVPWVMVPVLLCRFGAHMAKWPKSGCSFTSHAWQAIVSML